MLFDRKGKTPDATGAEGGEVTHHRNRLAGMWAAELLGLIGQAAHDYARELAHAHEQTPDDEKVVSRLSRDLHGKVTVQEIRAKLGHFLHEARRQLLDHKGK
jgi:hypothetical protein